MESVINEYKTYLQSILDDHNSGKLHVAGIKNRTDILQDFEEDFNNRSNRRAIELFRANPDDELKKMFQQAAREYYQKFMRENKFG